MRFNYLELDETIIHCPHCSWIGFGKQTEQDDHIYDYGIDLLCPKCDKTLGLCLFPTKQESLASPKVSDEEKERIRNVMARRENFEKTKLKDVSQLKEIYDESFTLLWTFWGEGDRIQTLRIMYHDEIIWEELAWYEYYERYIEIAKILKAKYGIRLTDLIPSENSSIFLYGDKWNADEIVNEARKKIRSNTLF